MNNINQSLDIIYQTITELSQISNQVDPKQKELINKTIEQLEDVRRYLYDEINDRTIYNVQ